MANAVTCRTFCNRLNKCYYYTEKDNYIKYIDIFFSKLLTEYPTIDMSLLDLFSIRVSSRSYTGIKFVYSKDRKEYRDLCIKCAINIDNFLSKYELTNIMDTVVYKDKIKCHIGGIYNNTNFHFCFKSLQEMQKDIDFYLLNNYIYNISKGYENNCLIFNVQSDAYIQVKYEELDYTIRRGFLKSIINSRIRKQGEYCITCKNACKPMFINGLDRLVSLI